MANRADTFDRTNTSGSLGTPTDAGSAWVHLNSGVWEVVDNRGKSASHPDNVAYLESSLADVNVEATVFSVGASAGLAARITDGDNFLYMAWNTPGTQFEIGKVEGGSYTTLDADTSTTLSGGEVIRFELNGTSLKGYIDDVEIVSVTSSFNQAATKHGLFSYADDTTQFDEMSIVEFGAGGGDAFPVQYYQHMSAMMGA